MTEQSEVDLGSSENVEEKVDVNNENGEPEERKKSIEIAVGTDPVNVMTDVALLKLIEFFMLSIPIFKQAWKLLLEIFFFGCSEFRLCLTNFPKLLEKPKDPIVFHEVAVNTEEIVEETEEKEEVTSVLPNYIDEEKEGKIVCIVPFNAAHTFTVDSHIHGLKWNVTFSINPEFVAAHVLCNSESMSLLWAVEASIDLSMKSSLLDRPSIDKQHEANFDYQNKKVSINIGETHMIYNSENKYIDSGKLTVYCTIKVTKRQGFRSRAVVDFMTYQPGASDVALIVEQTPLYVNRRYLAWYSSFFNAIFFSNFQEKGMEQVSLEDVSCENFIELLNVIYPSHKKVDDDNVESLLALADRFDIPYVLNECETFLIRDSKKTLARRLWLSDKFFLTALQENCIGLMKTRADIIDLKEDEENFKTLGHITKAALLEREISM